MDSRAPRSANEATSSFMTIASMLAPAGARLKVIDMYDFFEYPSRVLMLSHVLLIGGLVALVVGAILAYGMEHELPLPCLIAAHAMTILGPTAIKLGYVMRLLTFNRLRKDTAPHLHGFAQ
jgi:hypothetical protein